MKPPVFLTGATGFLGMEVVARLLERGDRDVIALVRVHAQAGRRDVAGDRPRAAGIRGGIAPQLAHDALEPLLSGG